MVRGVDRLIWNLPGWSHVEKAAIKHQVIRTVCFEQEGVGRAACGNVASSSLEWSLATLPG
jgi:hypothetical protein